MTRRVVLVSLEFLRPGDARTSLGIASIAAALHADGLEVETLTEAVNAPDFDEDALAEIIHRALKRAGDDALLGIGAYVWNERVLVRLLPRIRARFDGPIVLGGPQISYAEPGTLEASYPGVTWFVRGNGERAMVALARGDAPDAAGVHVAGCMDRGAQAPFDLAQLPSPYLDKTLPIGTHVRWETQRGCPFSCTFCQFRDAAGRRAEIGEARVLDELRAFAEADVERISVLDPIFNANRARAVTLLREARDLGLRARLSLQCRFEYVNDAFLDALGGLDVELEFGLQTIHEVEGKAVQRPNNMRKVEEVVHQLRARGIYFEVSLIYGLPHQTLASFEESVAWCVEREVPRVRAWPLMLLRGTELHRQRTQLELVESTDRDIPVVIATPSFSTADHVSMEARAAWLPDNYNRRQSK